MSATITQPQFVTLKQLLAEVAFLYTELTSIKASAVTVNDGITTSGALEMSTTIDSTEALTSDVASALSVWIPTLLPVEIDTSDLWIKCAIQAAIDKVCGSYGSTVDSTQAVDHHNYSDCKNRKNNTTYRNGVIRHFDGRWRAKIKVDGSILHLGIFNTANEAKAAYFSAANEHFGKFERTK